jgi:hypothetical protein
MNADQKQVEDIRKREVKARKDGCFDLAVFYQQMADGYEQLIDSPDTPLDCEMCDNSLFGPFY